MITSLLVLAAVGTADPRIPLTQLLLDGRQAETLDAVETLTETSPETASTLGLHYLRGHLLDAMGRPQEAHGAFVEAMGTSPDLEAYARFRLAVNQIGLGHPEVAAGLLSRLLAKGAPKALLRPSVELFVRTIEDGGDCRLLGQLDGWLVPERERRVLTLTRADCEVRSGETEQAVNRLLALIRDNSEDEAARGAAGRLDLLKPTEADAPTALIIGLTFHRHRQFELSIAYLQKGLGGRHGPPSTGVAEDVETHYALARSYFWQENYLVAASHFGQIAAVTEGEDKARALYQQGRSYELSGNWRAASQSYRIGYLEDPEGRWADAALLSAMRVEWRGGSEESALQLFEMLGSRREWRRLRSRGALFLASSDIARGRLDRAATWLETAARADRHAENEVEYWRGRLAEQKGDLDAAFGSYATVASAAPFNPFAQAARAHLATERFGPRARRIGGQLASSGDLSSLYQAWVLLGDDTAVGRAARDRLTAGLRRLRQARDFLQVQLEPSAEWPLWRSTLKLPEEQLLALGVWNEGSPVIPKHFPVANVSLAYTGSRLLSQATAHRDSLRIAEILGERARVEIPDGLLPEPLRRQLYPLPYSEKIFRHAERHNVDPFLLAALIREESRFDRHAVSPASARGLTQFVLPTAKRLAPAIGRKQIRAVDLHDPEISIALGAAYLAELAQRFDQRAPLVIAAYNAGERQTELWRSYCYGREAPEFLSKVGFPETRAYLHRVLSSRAQYRDLYGEPAGPSAG